MSHIETLSASIRKGRNSDKVSLYFKNYIESKALCYGTYLKLNEYNFQLFDEHRMTIPENSKINKI